MTFMALFVRRASVFLVTVTLVVGMVACGNATTEYYLLIGSTEGGEVAQPGTGRFSYDEGTVVDLVADANEGCRFVNWTGNISTVADVEAAATTITMNDNYVVYAVFGREIRDWYDLDAVRNNPFGEHTLMNDLDSTTAGYDELASPTADQGKGWQPIATWPFSSFTGSFDGQGHEIRDLFINRPIESPVGLFGLAGEGAVIKDVGMVDVTVTGYYYVGGLIGYNNGAVTDSYSTGDVSGVAGMAGGLVGRNSGTLSNSYSTASVTSIVSVGGLVADNWDGTVSNSYSTGSVIGSTCVGGLVAYNYWGTVTDSYSSSSVTGDEEVGGLVGRNYDSTVSNSFWDTETSGQPASAAGTGKNTTQMQDIDTFSGVDWDIVEVANPSTRNPAYVWNIVDDETYPFLSWQPVF
jgi:hypothetical protein